MFKVAGGSGFARRVYALVRAIPPGRVATYGDIAVMAGHRGAARAVGNVMRGCSDNSVPCHRVIGAGGAVGGYGGWPGLKRQLLAAEGVIVRGTRVKNFEDLRWDGAASTRRRTRKAASTRQKRPGTARS